MGGVCSKPKLHEVETVEVVPSREPSPVFDSEPEPKLSVSSSLEELGKTSDFEGNLIFESDRDEIKLPHTEMGYPEPEPIDIKNVKNAEKIPFFNAWKSENSSDDASNDMEPISQAELDDHARKTPRSALKSFKQLIEYLEKPAKGKQSQDEIIVRALLVWLSDQEVEKFSNENGNKDTPLGFLSLLDQKRTTYSTFFTVLCRQAGIQCTQIHGLCKAGDYEPGDREDIYTYWNAVYINESWQIINPFWACRSVFGKSSGSWIKLEASGKTIVKKQKESEGVLRNAFKEYYIMTNPEQYIYRCYPDDKKWQLLSNPISKEMFFDQAYLLPPFWGLGMKLTSENKCFFKSHGGTVTITFQAPKEIANVLNMDYNFFLKEDSSSIQIDHEMLKPNKMPRLVTKIRNATDWKFIIQFPVEGTYKIAIYGSPVGQRLLWLCEFGLKCTRKTQGCQLTPFNAGLLGYGPGPVCDKNGLLLPSHRSGLVTAEKGKQTSLSFLLDSDISKTLAVKTELIDSNSVDHSEHVKSKIDKKYRELQITASIIKDGDYGLRILTGKCDQEDIVFTIVCNYFITTSLKHVREKTNQRLSRQRLLSAIENGGITEIEDSINRCLKEKIPDSDLDIENAQRKLDVLRFRKDVHDALMRRHLETTEKTIHRIENSVYERIFRETLRHLKDFAVDLRSLHGFTQELPNILNALAELNHTHAANDLVIKTLLGLLCLFGKEQRSITNVEDIHAIAGEMSHMVRTEKSNLIKPANAKKAQEIIEMYSYDQIRNVNMAAAAVYKWIEDVVCTFKKSEHEDESDEA